MSGEQGFSKIKAFLGVATAFVGLIAEVSRLSDVGHAILSTMIFSFFVTYAAADVLRWYYIWKVLLIGPAVILVAAYWWVGFMAKHGIPAQPLLPAAWYPPDWAYLAMAACLGLYCLWDIRDAWEQQYDNWQWLCLGAAALLVGVCICAVLTLRGPQGAA